MNARPFDPIRYYDLKDAVIAAGYESEVAWAENVQPVSDPLSFLLEYCWVLLNSGMRNQVAAGIWRRLRPVLLAGEPVRSAFGHPGKAAAMEFVRDRKDDLFTAYCDADDKLAFLRGLPWIGPITCYHLAKNFGHDCAKPDRHLARIASAHGTDAESLCAGLAAYTGDRIGTVDLVLWRASNLGLLDTGSLHPAGL